MIMVVKKFASYETEQYLEERGARASKEKFMAVLAKVPSTEPSDFDK